ncbi:hypothetical protein Bca101_007980 [Brassica carinata]
MQFFGGSEINPSPQVPTASGNNAHMMYVFNRNGVCLLYKEWNRPLHTLNPQQDHKLMFGLLFSLKSLTAKMDPVKLVISSSIFPFDVDLINFGSIYPVCSADKGNLGVPQLPGQGCSFHSFRTNTYKLSFMETPSGIKLELAELYHVSIDIDMFVDHLHEGQDVSWGIADCITKIILVTHPKTGDLRESLKYIYGLYVEYVAKNPIYNPGSPVKSELFNTALDQYVRSIS